MRPEGFYFVSTKGHWVVAEWFECNWYLTGRTKKYSDEDFVVIGNFIEMPL